MQTKCSSYLCTVFSLIWAFLLLLGPNARVLVSLKHVKNDSSLKLLCFFSFLKSQSSPHLCLLTFLNHWWWVAAEQHDWGSRGHLRGCLEKGKDWLASMWWVALRGSGASQLKCCSLVFILYICCWWWACTETHKDLFYTLDSKINRNLNTHLQQLTSLVWQYATNIAGKTEIADHYIFKCIHNTRQQKVGLKIIWNLEPQWLIIIIIFFFFFWACLKIQPYWQ